MGVRRFLVESGFAKGEQVALPAGEAAHARKVLRLKPGAEVCLLDGQGAVAKASLTQVSKDMVSAHVLEVRRPKPPKPKLVICPGLAKGPAMDFLARCLTELMVDEVRPFYGQYTVPLLKDPGRRLERWSRLGRQALKQCGAAAPPLWHAPQSLGEVMGLAPDGAARLMLYEDERKLEFARALADSARAGEVWVLVGPEGGFSGHEARAAREAGFVACGFRGAVLRAETASLAAASMVRFSQFN